MQTTCIFEKVRQVHHYQKHLLEHYMLLCPFNFIIFIIWKEQMLLFTVINQINLKPSLCFMFRYTLISVLIGIHHGSSNGLFFLQIAIEKYWLMVFIKSYNKKLCHIYEHCVWKSLYPKGKKISWQLNNWVSRGM